MTPLNIISLLLIVLTFVSYIPQYHRLLTLGSSNGLSIASILSTTLVAQFQAATMYFLFRMIVLEEYGIPVASPPSTRDWFNLSQILVQWICSLFLLALILYLPTSANDNPTPDVLSKLVAILLWILHILLFIFSIPLGGRPQDLVFKAICEINAYFANPFVTVIGAISFYFQARVMFSSAAATSEQNALSKWTLGLQSFTFLLLAVSWPFRLSIPDIMWRRASNPAVLTVWYPWVGWACVNSAIMALGQGIILAFYIRRSGPVGETSSTQERQSLLGSDEL